MKVIELRDVRKTYDLGEVQVEALRGVSLDLESGEFIALVGPSGSGKSTLMNTLGCLDRPTSGSYLLAGQEVANLSSDERALVRNGRSEKVIELRSEFQSALSSDRSACWRSMERSRPTFSAATSSTEYLRP